MELNEREEREERVLELHWQQTAPRRWIAVIIDQQTGERREACSQRELQAALNSMLGKESANLAARLPIGGLAID